MPSTTTPPGMTHAPPPVPSPRDYHEQTAHSLARYAPGPATLDWEQQPDPYRHYVGAERLLLPLDCTVPEVPFAGLTKRTCPRPPALGWDSIGRLLRLGLGISAWKVMGDARWAVRCNPSSGNLHPVEAYLVLPSIDGHPAGLYHYDPREHALELRCVHPHPPSGTPSAPAPGSLLLGLSVIPWREAWKYGVRAWRYCQLDLGHALAALDYAAATLGWRLRPAAGWDSGSLGQLLGLDRAADFEANEPEYPQALILASPADAKPEGPAPGSLQALVSGSTWHGKANRLDPRHHYRWPVVDAMGRASGPIDPALASGPSGGEPSANGPTAPSERSAAEVILARRSARAFDTQTSIHSDRLYRLLQACLPAPGLAPWDALAAPARLQLLLFVHRVDGLEPGLYLLARDTGSLPGLRQRLRPEFEWGRPSGCPGSLALYRLVAANARAAAGRLACHQAIASGAGLALAMVADLPADSSQATYDGLLREAGCLGQVLYLEAEAMGLGSSGIGCFFDPALQELLGCPGGDLQVFYMFAIGPAPPDLLMSDLPAYER